MSVLVSGMHRSGTSAIARLTHAFGLSPGAAPLMGPAADNPRGFYERRDVSDFNDRWLERLGGAWWAPPVTTAATWRHLDEHTLHADRTALDLFAADAPPWFSKDPRTALLLPLWDRLTLREHPVIVCVRAPAEVALSLHLRDGLSLRRGLALWVAYTTTLLRDLGRRPTLLLDHLATLDNPARAIDALDAFLRACGHTPSPDWSRSAAERLIEPALHRAEQRGDDGDLSAQLEALHAFYRQIARRHGEAARDVGPTPPLAWADEALDELRELYEARAARDAAIAAAQSVPPPPVPTAATGHLRQAHDDLLERHHALTTERDVLAERIEHALAASVAAQVEIRELKVAHRDAMLAAEMELERAEAAELELADAQVRIDAALALPAPTTASETTAVSPDDGEDPLAEIVRLEGELHAAAAQLEHRRAALAEMSLELERRRARAYRAEAAVAAAHAEVDRLRVLERESAALREELVAVRFERANLRDALARSLAAHADVVATLERLLASRAWRLGQALAAPRDLVRRSPGGRRR